MLQSIRNTCDPGDEIVAISTDEQLFAIAGIASQRFSGAIVAYDEGIVSNQLKTIS